MHIDWYILLTLIGQFFYAIHKQSYASHISVLTSQHISMLTTCTFILHVCTIEFSFLKRRDDIGNALPSLRGSPSILILRLYTE